MFEHYLLDVVNIFMQARRQSVLHMWIQWSLSVLDCWTDSTITNICSISPTSTACLAPKTYEISIL